MLSSSNFLPRCTEFIVEWSFGKTYPSDPADISYVAGRAGEIIWHGMARWADGTPTNVADPEAVAEPYTWDPNGGGNRLYRHRLRYRQVDGDVQDAPRYIIAQNIHGQQVGIPYLPLVGEPVASYFGYVDPSFNPDQDAPPGVTAPDRKLISPNDAASATLPWAWPRLVRVTLGLADPSDPTIEQRFQFVFEMPPTPEP
jgi:hypothetical protein